MSDLKHKWFFVGFTSQASAESEVIVQICHLREKMEKQQWHSVVLTLWRVEKERERERERNRWNMSINKNWKCDENELHHVASILRPAFCTFSLVTAGRFQRVGEAIHPACRIPVALSGAGMGKSPNNLTGVATDQTMQKEELKQKMQKNAHQKVNQFHFCGED